VNQSTSFHQQILSKKFGLIAIRAGAGIEVKAPMRIKTAGGAWVEKGSRMTVGVQPMSRHPDLAHSWRCREIVHGVTKTPWRPCEHMADAPQGFASKEALVRAHPSPASLVANEATHLYYAVAECPAVTAKPAPVDADGNETGPATPARPAVFLVLSEVE
jgi:hypothetical protein